MMSNGKKDDVLSNVGEARTSTALDVQEASVNEVNNDNDNELFLIDEHVRNKIFGSCFEMKGKLHLLGLLYEKSASRTEDEKRIYSTEVEKPGTF